MIPNRLRQLVTLSRALGDPRRDYVRLGEGNTSAMHDGRSFWVKASGVPLAGIRAGDFVLVRMAEMHAWLRGRRPPRRPDSRPPSIEALFHAILLQVPGVTFIGHTHPTVVNRVLCARRSRALVRGRLFPDEVVYCGPESVYVPYRDPGVPLAREIQRRVAAYRARHRMAPRLILLENHGIVALGQSPHEVLAVTDMAVKAAEVLWGAILVGGARPLTASQVRVIARRPDEQYRRRMMR